MFEDFKNKYLGKKVDVDGLYGGQCVDLFNAWNRDHNGTYINCSPSGYARSIAENKKNNGILKYFQETAVNNMIEGTVVVYGNCNFAPVSHVCFFIKDNGNGTYQALQQNDKNRQYVTIDNNPYDGIIGAFIPNQIVEEKKKSNRCGKPVKRNEKVEQVEIFETITSLRARNKPNGEVLGYMNSGIYNLLEHKTDGDYEWLKVEENVWFANSSEWCKILSKKEEPKTEPPTEPKVDEDKVKIAELEKQVKTKDEEITLLKGQIETLENRILEVTEERDTLKEKQPKEIFTCTKTADYQIKLFENEKLFIK